MNYIFTFSAEELIVLLSVAGFDEEASSLLDSSRIGRGSKELEAIYNSSINQLKIKGMWDVEKERSGENPLHEELITFLEMYASSRYMIRATNEEAEKTLVLHYIDFNLWLHHLVEENSIHRFSILQEKELVDSLEGFYGFPELISKEKEQYFSLTDRQFDLLKDPRNVKTVKETFIGSPKESEAFDRFSEAINKQGYEMDNLAVFFINEKNELLLENIAFLFFDEKGIWLAEYMSKQEKPVNIRLIKSEEWRNFLENAYLFTSEIINERSVLNS